MELNREQIIKALERYAEHGYCVLCPCVNECTGVKSLMLDALSLIKELNKENERLRAEGEWLTPKSRDADDWKECSRCGYYFDVSVGDIPTPFCPNCGARMKGE